MSTFLNTYWSVFVIKSLSVIVLASGGAYNIKALGMSGSCKGLRTTVFLKPKHLLLNDGI